MFAKLGFSAPKPYKAKMPNTVAVKINQPADFEDILVL